MRKQFLPTCAVLLVALACSGGEEKDPDQGNGGKTSSGGTASGRAGTAGALSGASGAAGTNTGGAGAGKGGTSGSAGTTAGTNATAGTGAGAGGNAGTTGGAGANTAGISGAAGEAPGGASGEGGTTGGTTGGTGGSSGASGTQNTGGGGTAGGGTGGTTTAGTGGTPQLDLPALTIRSDTSSVEFTPALLAAQIYSDWSTTGNATVQTGGVGDLFTNTDVDLATNADTRMLTESATRPNLRVIVTVTETFYRILARRSEVPTLADMAGKRLASLTTTSASYYAHSLLASVGIDDSEYTFVPGQLNNLPNMIDSGNVDALTIWEPAMQRAVNALGTDGIEFEFADKEANYREMVSLYTTAEKLADPPMRAAIVEFVRALLIAQDRFTNDPESVRTLVADAMSIDEELVAQFWGHERYPGKLPDNFLDLIEVEEVWLAGVQSRTARSRAQLAMMIDTTVLAEAKLPRQ